MMTVVKRYLPLMLMMLLLVFVISMLPENGKLDLPPLTEDQTSEPVDVMALTSIASH